MLGNIEIVALHESSISKDQLIDTNINNGKRPEACIDVPVTNINNRSCADYGNKDE